MKFYFNCNNRTQATALKECGVKNVLLSYQYCRDSFDVYANMFDSIGVIPGKGRNINHYYSWAKLNMKLCDFIAQFDAPLDMERTIKYYEKGEDIGITPVLTVNYLQHLSRLKLHEGRTVVLGKMGGNIEEDEQLRKLPSDYTFHGLAKGRWIKSMNIKSVNSSTWLSGVRGRKTDVYGLPSIEFGDKGRHDVAGREHAIQKYSGFLQRCGVEEESLRQGEYSALLKAPLALYYKPMLSALGFSSENFSSP